MGQMRSTTHNAFFASAIGLRCDDAAVLDVAASGVGPAWRHHFGHGRIDAMEPTAYDELVSVPRAAIELPLPLPLPPVSSQSRGGSASQWQPSSSGKTRRRSAADRRPRRNSVATGPHSAASLPSRASSTASLTGVLPRKNSIHAEVSTKINDASRRDRARTAPCPSARASCLVRAREGDTMEWCPPRSAG